MVFLSSTMRELSHKKKNLDWSYSAICLQPPANTFGFSFLLKQMERIQFPLWHHNGLISTATCLTRTSCKVQWQWTERNHLRIWIFMFNQTFAKDESNSRTSSCIGTSGKLNHSRRYTNSILSWTMSEMEIKAWSSLHMMLFNARTLISTKEWPGGLRQS